MANNLPAEAIEYVPAISRGVRTGEGGHNRNAGDGQGVEGWRHPSAYRKAMKRFATWCAVSTRC